jgi:hypothetical protein
MTDGIHSLTVSAIKQKTTITKAGEKKQNGLKMTAKEAYNNNKINSSSTECTCN